MSCMQTRSTFQPQRVVRALAYSLLLFTASHIRLNAQKAWSDVGPAGGDARAFAAVPGQPLHLYLGTTDGWLFESLNGGSNWRRLVQLDSADDMVLDSIVVDSANPSTIYAAAWKVDHPGGGLWISRDSGKNWKETEALKDQSILALVQAPSDPRMLFAGTLQGVFRSSDAGRTWDLISPPGSTEIHEVESLAVDPADPRILYAGTWHLPWKTADGGKSWKNIKQGVIEDSDVFSIIVDPAQPGTVFLSACSGIYKSEVAGELFHKVQGIPSDARRTRVLMQDPRDHQIVYAGTTEGLYKTTDGGKTFNALTGPEVIVNDVFVDPANSSHVLMATDRGGVMASTDAGATFAPSNDGFSARKVDALLVDRADPQHMYAGVVNDKTFGGAFETLNGGANWQQIGSGLEGRDVFALSQAVDGTVVAATNHGIFALVQNLAAGVSAHWEPRNTIANTVARTATQTLNGKRINVEKRIKVAPVELQGKVNTLDASGDVWLASTSSGLLTSKDHGETWQGGPVMGSTEYHSVTTHGSTMAAARADGVVYSTDSGTTWSPMQIPTMLTRIHQALLTPDGTFWLGAREGVYLTSDLGRSWRWIQRLPFRDVDNLSYDATHKLVLASSRTSDQIYGIDPKSLTWKWWQTGYKIGEVRAAGGRLVAASLFDGVLVEPDSGGVASGQR